jgi:methanogenic corrinoid protein MtbC1/anti-sigma regulatory factor (Ser/Thr protein kinase)
VNGHPELPLKLTVPLRTSRLHRARARIRNYLEGCCPHCDPQAIEDVILCLQEAFSNAIRHSASLEPIEVTLTFTEEALLMSVKDKGIGFDSSSFDPHQRPNLLGTGGRGLYLMAQLMDEFSLRSDHGLEIKMRKNGLAPHAGMPRPPHPVLIARGRVYAREREPGGAQEGESSVERRVQELVHALLDMDQAAALATLGELPPAGDQAVAGEHIVVAALERIGDGWESGHISLARLYMAGRIAERCLDALPASAPVLAEGAGDHALPALVVLADHHTLGKRMVATALRASGQPIWDWGAGVSVDGLVERCQKERPEVLLISTLLLPSALKVREVVDRLERLGERPPVIVGGAPFRLDPRLWREVGADAVGRNSAEAVELVRCFSGGVTA